MQQLLPPLQLWPSATQVEPLELPLVPLELVDPLELLLEPPFRQAPAAVRLHPAAWIQANWSAVAFAHVCEHWLASWPHPFACAVHFATQSAGAPLDPPELDPPELVELLLQAAISPSAVSAAVEARRRTQVVIDVVMNAPLLHVETIIVSFLLCLARRRGGAAIAAWLRAPLAVGERRAEHLAGAFK